MKSLALKSEGGSKVAAVSMLGAKDAIRWSQTDEGVSLSGPKVQPGRSAWVYKIDLK